MRELLIDFRENERERWPALPFALLEELLFDFRKVIFLCFLVIFRLEPREQLGLTSNQFNLLYIIRSSFNDVLSI